MTTATTQPLTEAEIREALTRSIGMGFRELDDQIVMLGVVTDSDMARTRIPWDPGYTPDERHIGTLWADLTPEETSELHGLMAGVLHEVEDEATATLLERAVAATLAFAERHPDIPRGHYPLLPEEAA